MEGEGFLSAIEEEANRLIPFVPMDLSSSLDESTGDFDMLQDCHADIPYPDIALSDKIDHPGMKEFLEVELGDHELGNDRSAPNVDSSVGVPVISDPQPALNVSLIVIEDDDEEDEVICGLIKSKNEVQSLPPVPPVPVTLQPCHETVPVGIVFSNLGTRLAFDLNNAPGGNDIDDEKEVEYKRLKTAHGGTFGPFQNTGAQGVSSLITGQQSLPLQGPKTQNAGGQGSGHTGHNVSPANANNNECPQQQHFNRGGAPTGHGHGRDRGNT